MEGDPVALGVELIARVDAEELSVAAAVDRIETITSDPHLTRRILRTAEAEGVIERDGRHISPAGPAVDFETAVVTKEGAFTCRRCGTDITTGYFLNLDAGEVGPFGSSCIRKVTGRE